MSQKMLIIAGEASSALYAERLIEEFKNNNFNIEFYGVGSNAMEALGFRRLGKSEEMAVVGLQEVLAHYKDIKKVFNDVVTETFKEKPNVILLLDYPDFNFKLAKELSSLKIPVVYYISPQLWAWRTSRIQLVKKYINKMLVLFPFEKDFYKKHDVDVDFVGHPLLDEIDEKLFSTSFQAEQRSGFAISPNDFVVGLMPGSRKSEIKHHLSTQIKAAEHLLIQKPQVKVCVLVAATLNIDELKSQVHQPDKFIWVQSDPVKMIPMVDVVLCASGTATIFVGLLKKPMAVMYKMNAFTAFLAKRLVKNTPFFGMVNLILNKEVCKEFFQDQASPEELSAELLKLLNDKPYYDAQVSQLEELRVKLGSTGATQRVFKSLIGYFQ
jgi:lipid-A-disaccharide synthase